MRTHQPAFNERRDTVYARQNLVGILARAFYGGCLVNIFVFCSTWIGRKSVGVNGRASFDVLVNKGLERFSFGVGDNLQAAASKAFWAEQFHCNRHQYFAFGTASALAVAHTSKDGLIYLNVSAQHIVPGIADGAPKPVQHCPSRRVGPEPEDSMERFGRNAIFSGCHMPCGSKPDGQRRSGVVKNCARRGGNSIAACIAPPLAIFHAPALGSVTRWAFKAVLPSDPVKVVEASCIVRKPRHKFCVVARVIYPSFRRLPLCGITLGFHEAIITLP